MAMGSWAKHTGCLPLLTRFEGGRSRIMTSLSSLDETGAFLLGADMVKVWSAYLYRDVTSMDNVKTDSNEERMASRK